MINEAQAVAIRSPEGLLFRLYPAGLYRRFLALVVDFFLLALLLSQLAMLLAVFAYVGLALRIVLGFVLPLVYHVACEWLWRGQTVGKWLMGIYVCDVDGGQLALSQVLVRNLFRAVDFLPGAYLVGMICAGVDSHGRRLGDLAARTLVVSQQTTWQPSNSSAIQVHRNALRDYPQLALRLRQRLPAELLVLCYQSLLRRDELSAEAQVRVSSALSAALQDIAPFPDELLATLPAEQIVRNAVALAVAERHLAASSSSGGAGR